MVAFEAQKVMRGYCGAISKLWKDFLTQILTQNKRSEKRGGIKNRFMTGFLKILDMCNPKGYYRLHDKIIQT